MPTCVEIPCNWRDINVLYSNKYKNTPPFDKIVKVAQPICDKMESVFVPMHERKINVIELRDWIDEQVVNKVHIFNRFSYEKYNYRVDVIFLGTNFRFTDAHDACLFKLFWW